MDCGTPCSGSGSSSGYLSEGGCCGVITPASGLSSGEMRDHRVKDC